MNKLPRNFKTVFSVHLLLAAALLLAACGTPAPADVAPSTALPLEDCQLISNGQQINAECGQFSVPEDPSAPDGRQISLRVVRIPAVSRTPAPDPLVLLAGGPGQAASDVFLALIFSIERLRFDREILLIDQRGTGESALLACPDPETAGDAVIGAAAPLEVQLEEITACREKLGVDPALYTTAVAIQDLDAVRSALGYEQLNLLGVSYGTRAALEYLRRYPERVRTITLDGVVPPGWVLGQTMATDAQGALEHMLARCEAEEGCRTAFPNLAAEFEQLVAELDAQPVELTIPHPRTGEPTVVELNRESAGGAVRLMSYSDITAALLPLAIHSAAQGDRSLLASLYLQAVDSLGESIATGMYYSVFCTEDAPLLQEGEETGAYMHTRIADTRALCQAFLPDPPQTDVQQPLSSDVPALLISGEADPVTPPANGEAAAAMLPNSLHLVLPGMGHNNFYVGCLPSLLDDFLTSASVEDLDAACVQSIRPQPFFVSPVGPGK